MKQELWSLMLSGQKVEGRRALGIMNFISHLLQAAVIHQLFELGIFDSQNQKHRQFVAEVLDLELQGNWKPWGGQSQGGLTNGREV